MKKLYPRPHLSSLIPLLLLLWQGSLSCNSYSCSGLVSTPWRWRLSEESPYSSWGGDLWQKALILMRKLKPLRCPESEVRRRHKKVQTLSFHQRFTICAFIFVSSNAPSHSFMSIIQADGVVLISFEFKLRLCAHSWCVDGFSWNSQQSSYQSRWVHHVNFAMQPFHRQYLFIKSVRITGKFPIPREDEVYTWASTSLPVHCIALLFSPGYWSVLFNISPCRVTSVFLPFVRAYFFATFILTRHRWAFDA